MSKWTLVIHGEGPTVATGTKGGQTVIEQAAQDAVNSIQAAQHEIRGAHLQAGDQAVILNYLTQAPNENP